MKILYRIKNWGKYETAETRKLRALSWVPLPVKFHGTGYNILVRKHPDGERHFAAWCALLQVAAICQTRGVLTQDNGEPHDAESLALITHIDQQTFVVALERLSSKSIGWIEAQPFENEELDCKSPGTPGESPGTPADVRKKAGANRTEQNRIESSSSRKFPAPAVPGEESGASAAMTTTTITNAESSAQTEDPAAALKREVFEDLRDIRKLSPDLGGNVPTHVVDELARKLRKAEISPAAFERFMQVRHDAIVAGAAPPRSWQWFASCVRNGMTELREIEAGLKGGAHGTENG